MLGSSLRAILDGRFAGYGFSALAIIWVLQLERKAQQPVLIRLAATIIGVSAILLNLGLAHHSLVKIAVAIVLLLAMITLAVTKHASPSDS